MPWESDFRWGEGKETWLLDLWCNGTFLQGASWLESGATSTAYVPEEAVKSEKDSRMPPIVRNCPGYYAGKWKEWMQILSPSLLPPPTPQHNIPDKTLAFPQKTKKQKPTPHHHHQQQSQHQQKQRPLSQQHQAMEVEEMPPPMSS